MGRLIETFPTPPTSTRHEGRGFFTVGKGIRFDFRFDPKGNFFFFDGKVFSGERDGAAEGWWVGGDCERLFSVNNTRVSTTFTVFILKI